MTAPAGKNSIPVEKVLLQMDLSRGLDERSREEVGGDQSKLITKLENLVQDETGAWVKRPGLTETAAPAFTPRNLFGIRKGLAASDSSNNLWHLSEGNPLWVQKGVLPELGVTATQVAATISNKFQKMICAVSNSKWDILFHEGGPGTSNQISALMVVVDRGSGSVISKYDLSAITGSDTLLSIHAAFVRDNSKLHVWTMQSTGVNRILKVFQHDTDTAWPVSAGSFTVTTVDTVAVAGGFVTTDIGQTATGTVVTALSKGAYHYDTSAVVTHLALPAANDQFLSCASANGNVYFLVNNSPGATRRIYVTTEADITTTIAGGWNQNFAASTTDMHLAAYYDGVNVTLCVVVHTVGSPPGSPPTPVDSIPVVTTWFSTVAAATFVLSSTIYGWGVVSCPFEIGGKFFIHLFRSDGIFDASSFSVTPVGPHVIARLSDPSTTKHFFYNAGVPIYAHNDSLSLSAVLDPYFTEVAAEGPITGTINLSTARLNLYRIFKVPGSPTKVVAAAAQKIAQRTSSFTVFTLDLGASNKRQAVSFAGGDVLTGGAMTAYDGWSPEELGFADYPSLACADSGVAGNVNGIVNYVALFKSLDATGNVAYSRMTAPISLTVANKKVSGYVQDCHVTKKAGHSGDQRVIVEIYRTASGGTQYFLCADSQQPDDGSAGANVVYLPASNRILLFTDNMLDATLITKPVLYRQPGTSGTALDRYPPPGGSISVQHKDRLFVVEPAGVRVFFSSFYVDGESPWFNPVFSIQPHGGTGPITGLASMDGRLFVFKKDAVFVVDGDGPPENGGTGTEFTAPTMLAAKYGCIDQRSMVTTPEGIFYRSERGIEILSRSLQVSWIGDRVQDTVDAHPVTTGAVLDDSARVRMFLSVSETVTASGGGVEVVYDMSCDSWSTSVYTVNGTVGESVQSVARSDGEVYVCGPSASCPIYKLDDATGSDDGYYVPWTAETGYIRPSGPQGRYRLHDCLVLGKRRNNHQLKLSIDSDYDSYEKSETFQPDKMQRTLVEMNIQPKKDKPVLFRLKIEENYPLDSTAYPRGNGFGMDLLGICFQVSPLAGAQFVAPFRKG